MGQQKVLFIFTFNMANIKTKELSKIGYTQDKARSLIINLVAKHCKHHSKEALLDLLIAIRETPEDFLTDEIWKPVAETFVDKPIRIDYQSYALMQETGLLKMYGSKEIDQSAKKQMELAMSLPIARQGALMPDAHTGFGLPIGGVLATENAVIPYGVGMDIGCRMALSIFPENDKYVQRYAHAIKVALKTHTHFGMDGGLPYAQSDAILDSPKFQETELLRSLHAKAVRQLGSSGSGNHFVEFGEIELFEANDMGLPAGKYLALLSHSGSRGLGAAIAKHYTQIAMQTCKLPREAQHLAWLDLATEAGQEYWLSMELAGAYAAACHTRIHHNLSKALGLSALTCIENHHNFAWKEQLADGNTYVVHRKGATPAHEGEWGIIPGSMTTPAYLVRGKGVDLSLNSASHGAGRAMSRQRAKESTTASALKKLLSQAGVTLIGGSVEESPIAYKDIDKVMSAQQELVSVKGKFLPKIVRMNKE